MFDRAFFETSLDAHVQAKRKCAADGSASVMLASDETIHVWSVEEVGDTFAVFEIFPRKGKARATGKEERKSGAPLFDLDRLALPYSVIGGVEVTTLTPRDKAAGFRRTGE
jgi:hypothetical protein